PVIDDGRNRNAACDRCAAIEERANARHEAVVLARVRQHDDGILARSAGATDPRHTESALRDGDAARFFQKLAAIANAYDRRVDGAEHRVAVVQPLDALLRVLALADIACNTHDADEHTR